MLSAPDGGFGVASGQGPGGGPAVSAPVGEGGSPSPLDARTPGATPGTPRDNGGSIDAASNQSVGTGPDFGAEAADPAAGNGTAQAGLPGPGHDPVGAPFPGGAAGRHPNAGPSPVPGPEQADGSTARPPSDPAPGAAEALPGERGRPAAPVAVGVPRQKRPVPRTRAAGAALLGPDPAALPDLLDHPDPGIAAEAATVENLLRCWVRESGIGRPDGPVGTLLRIPLPASGVALLVAVRHWSPTGWHRFAPARLEGAPADAPALDAVTLAALIAREGTGRAADLVGRVADSVRRTAEFIADRRQRPIPPEPIATDLFLTAEQSLLLGHPLQPDPKSREGLSEAEVRRYSPELHGSFPLHWFAIAPSVLATDSAWTERGRPVPATQLLSRLAPGLPMPAGTTPLPLHPWQARDLLDRPAVAALRDAGLLTDLGPYGDPWYPTSSVRTVHRPGSPAMLKLSLGLRITNSRRENLRKELHRGVEVHRLLRAGLAEQWQAAHPGFDIVRDPAWVAVDTPDGPPVPGLDALLRHNPFRSGDDPVCIAALTAPRPWPGRTTMRSRLAETVSRLAASTGRPTRAVAAEWFLRYLDHVVLPVLGLDALAGIALEAHQQNTLVLLDPAGWPVGGRYRDNQGYYFRDSHRAELEFRLPGIGNVSDTFVSDAVTDERFAYYLGINNVFGLIGAFGSQNLADERVLLAAFRRFLGKASRLGPLPSLLLDSPTLRCKANLLTRLGGLDELVGPVDTQSVYVTITNPLLD
ncbi:hypothetical protein GCM10010347_47350 [Streptomyces cirratus]|uniref:Iron transporter n=1 Tax=Streptomyces cirratus TaxID=68187 RepID=A0ABQ3EXN0_9ACTN|nr:IucA/IucC family protein [Streptomyces cirratus]GHB71583.1 hypothetical protein GCM10010347_47350 [Streptomyces cirratus]